MGAEPLTDKKKVKRIADLSWDSSRPLNSGGGNAGMVGVSPSLVMGHAAAVALTTTFGGTPRKAATLPGGRFYCRYLQISNSNQIHKYTTFVYN